MAGTLDLELLLSLTGGLGRLEVNEDGSSVYITDEDCLACLRDIARFLRQDDPVTREAFHVLGQMNLVKTDLVPIIVSNPTDSDLVYSALKVATFQSMPVEPGTDNPHQQVLYTQQVKEAFLSLDALAVVVGLVEEPLSRHPHMLERDSLIVQLVVAFVRNLLSIPDAHATAGSRGNHRTHMNQDLLARFADDNVFELLLIIAQHADEAPFRSEAPLLLDVFQKIFSGSQPEELLAAVDTPAAAERPRQKVAPTAPAKRLDLSGVHAVLRRERQAIAAVSNAVPRHARFGSTFVQRGFDDARPRVLARNPNTTPSTVLPASKRATAKAQGGPADGAKARVGASVLVKLRKFAESLLVASYDVLMDNIRRDLEPGLNLSRLQRDDFIHFMQLAQFFTRFVRLRKEVEIKQMPSKHVGVQQPFKSEGTTALSPFACISTTMGWETFHMVHVLWLSNLDIPTNSDEKDWDLQHLSTALLKEMLYALDLALYTGSPADSKAADRLQRRLLHDDMKESGLLPVLSRMLKDFKHRHQPRSHAADLVETLHVVLRMLERLNRLEAGSFLVKRKHRTHGPRQKQGTPASPQPDAPETLAAIQEEAASPAVGGTSMSPTAAAGAAQHTPTKGGGTSSLDHDMPLPSQSDDHQAERDRDPLEELHFEEADEARRQAVKEVAYNLHQRIRQELAYPAVIHFYIWLLQGHDTLNSAALNHCIIAFMRRIAHESEGLHLEPMLYQLSALEVFQSILDTKEYYSSSGGSELLYFAKKVVRNLTARLAPELPEEPVDDTLGDDAGASSVPAQEDSTEERAKQRKMQEACASMMFIELMFWKNAKDAEAVRDEYDWKRTYGRHSRQRRALRQTMGEEAKSNADGVNVVKARKRHAKQLMDEDQVQQLRQLFKEHGHKKGCLTLLVEGMDGLFKRSQISRQLRSMGLKRGVLSEAVEAELRTAFDQHKDESRHLDKMMEVLGSRLTKVQIAKYLRKMGLKRDKGAACKSKKHTQSQTNSQGSDVPSRSSASSAESSSSDSDGEAGPGSRAPAVADADRQHRGAASSSSDIFSDAALSGSAAASDQDDRLPAGNPHRDTESPEATARKAVPAKAQEAATWSDDDSADDLEQVLQDISKASRDLQMAEAVGEASATSHPEQSEDKPDRHAANVPARATQLARGDMDLPYKFTQAKRQPVGSEQGSERGQKRQKANKGAEACGTFPASAAAAVAVLKERNMARAEVATLPPAARPSSKPSVKRRLQKKSDDAPARPVTDVDLADF